MAIYTGHLSPMPANFEPPRLGTMPKRTPSVTIGLNNIEHNRAMRRSESPGHLIGGRYKRDLDASRKRGTAASHGRKSLPAENRQ